MKKLIMAMGMLVAGTASAGQGQALIPHYAVFSQSSCHLHVSNISQNAVDVSFEFYDQNGNTLNPSLSTWYAFSGHNPLVNKVSLGAKKTGAISLNTQAAQVAGFGYVRWSSDVDQDTALVADFHCQAATNRHRSILINEQKPF